MTPTANSTTTTHVPSKRSKEPRSTCQHQAQTAPGLSPRAAAMLSAKSSWIRAGRAHGMLGVDRSAGKRLEESDVPGDVHAQIEGDRLVQTVVCRG